VKNGETSGKKPFSMFSATTMAHITVAIHAHYAELSVTIPIARPAAVKRSGRLITVFLLQR
jgi:hypothetical protein